jgi:predicted nucleic acid-binding protein
MPDLVVPDSSFYIGRSRLGRDPFSELHSFADDWEFATCGMVVLEVCRGRSDPNVLRRFQERFSVMLYLATTSSTWERANALAWNLDRRGIVLPAQDLVIAACALHHDAAVLTFDAHFQEVPGLRVVNELT